MIGPGQDRYKLVPTAYDRVLVQQNQGDSKVDAQLHGCAPSCQWLILFVGFNPAHYKMTYGSAEGSISFRREYTRRKYPNWLTSRRTSESVRKVILSVRCAA